MTAKATQTQKTHIAPQMTSAQLGRLCGVARMPMSDALFKATPDADGLYDVAVTLPIIYAHFQAKAARSTNTDDRKRKDAADAERAEIRVAEARKELMPRKHCLAIWRDGLTKIRQKIANAPYLSPAHREKLLKEFREIEVDKPE